MEKRTAILAQIEQQGLLPLYFHPDEAVSIAVMQSLYEAGIRAIEYTNRGQQALKNFEAMKRIASSEMKELYLGIGTIKDAAMADTFIQAGADFVISPGLTEDVYDSTYSSKTLWIPGCMSPSEIMKAEQYGITCIKLFPGVLLGPAYLKAVKEVFPGMRFMPTGGVVPEKENLQSWFDAGVFAVGMGSALIGREMLEQKKYSALTELTKNTLDAIKQLRKK